MYISTVCIQGLGYTLVFEQMSEPITFYPYRRTHGFTTNHSHVLNYAWNCGWKYTYGQDTHTFQQDQDTPILQQDRLVMFLTIVVWYLI